MTSRTTLRLLLSSATAFALAVFGAPARATTFDALTEAPIDTLLADPHTAKGFRIVTLSNAAEACVGRYRDGDTDRDEAIACVDRIAAAALDERLSPYGAPVARARALGHNGLYLTHLAIVLGARDALHPDACDEALHARIVRHLAAEALADPTGIGRSFASAGMRWPADQAATLYALWLHDQAHGTDLVTAPLAKYLAYVPSDALPPSEATGTAPDASTPRGCALSFTVRYLSAVAPDYAHMVWDRMRAEGFVVRVGPVVGVREWPPGIDRAGDIDSGPIVSGIGASATAFGWSAANAIGDAATAARLARTASLGALVAGVAGDGVSDAASSALATAIAAQAAVEDPLGHAPRP